MLTFSHIIGETCRVLRQNKNIQNVSTTKHDSTTEVRLACFNSREQLWYSYLWEITEEKIEGTSTLHQLVILEQATLAIVYRETDKVSEIAWEIKGVLEKILDLYDKFGDNPPKLINNIEKIAQEHKPYKDRVPGFMLSAEPAVKETQDEDDIPF